MIKTTISRFGIALTVALVSATTAGIFLPGLTDAQTPAQVVPTAVPSQQNARDSKAQSGAAKASGTSTTDALPVGRVIYAELTQTIDVRKVKPGEPIEAKVTLGVLSHGKVLIAEDATISGHVTKAIERSENEHESALGIVFDRAETVDGKQLPLNLTVQAIGIGSLRSPLKDRLGAYVPYSAAASPLAMGNSPPARGREENELPPAETKPALDIGSKGMVGVEDLKLTEGTDATHGSLVTSTEKNVKLDNRWQVVLRVIAPKHATGAKK